MRNHVRIDRTGLIDIQAEAGEVLQPQVPVAIDVGIIAVTNASERAYSLLRFTSARRKAAIA